jgi:hypothetical protein
MRYGSLGSSALTGVSHHGPPQIVGLAEPETGLRLGALEVAAALVAHVVGTDDEHAFP